MIRKILLLAGLIGLALTACGQPVAPAAPPAATNAVVSSTASAGDSPTAAPASALGKISFMIFGDPAEKAAYESLVSAFKQHAPDIQVDLIHIPSQNDYRTRLGTDFAAGTPADVVLINYRRYASFAAKGVLEPLGPYLAQSRLVKESDFYPEAIAPFYWRGTLMCIPQNLSSLVVYYNKKLFQQAGVADPSADWTWDVFLQAAKALTKDTDGDGVIDQYGLGTEASIFRAAPFIWQNGGELVDPPTAPTKLALETPAAKEAIQWFVDLQVKHKVVPDRVQEQAEASENRFQNGQLGMFLNSRRGVPTYREISGFDWDVAPLPQGKQRAGILHADAYCMPAASKNKASAWAFVEFANSPEGQTTVAKSGRTVPSLKAVAESPAFLNPAVKPANSKVFLDVIPYIRGVPVMETWVDIEDTVGAELERAFYGEATVDQAIKAANDRTREFFTPQARR
jgi:multiple sugar transport system substrate-binding protein